MNELHAVFGGELTDPSEVKFRNPNEIHFVGFFTEYQSALDAWKEHAQRTVDNALMRYFLVDIRKMMPE